MSVDQANPFLYLILAGIAGLVWTAFMIIKGNGEGR